MFRKEASLLCKLRRTLCVKCVQSCLQEQCRHQSLTSWKPSCALLSSDPWPSGAKRRCSLTFQNSFPGWGGREPSFELLYGTLSFIPQTLFSPWISVLWNVEPNKIVLRAWGYGPLVLCFTMLPASSRVWRPRKWGIHFDLERTLRFPLAHFILFVSVCFLWLSARSQEPKPGCLNEKSSELGSGVPGSKPRAIISYFVTYPNFLYLFGPQFTHYYSKIYTTSSFYLTTCTVFNYQQLILYISYI